MLKIPSFILGGLLILTGLVGYLAQDSSLSIKISGPLASDAEFVLKDSEHSHTLDFIPCPDSAGENAWWIVHKLNDGHAKDTSADNYRLAQTGSDATPKSFWYASSSGDTLKGIFQESENYHNAGTENYESIPWPEIDVEKAKVRFIYDNAGGTTEPVTLSSTNWENVINAPEDGESLTFGKSWTAFIPSIIGLILILCAVAADKAPNAKKHIMHVAVLIGLLGFFSVAGKVGTAFSEMSWWRGEPYQIIGASSLKPTTMLLTAGLLLIYVILCVVSFVAARKEMAAQAARDEARKAAVLKKASKRNEEADSDSDKKEKSSKPKPKSESTKEKEEKKDPAPTVKTAEEKSVSSDTAQNVEKAPDAKGSASSADSQKSETSTVKEAAIKVAPSSDTKTTTNLTKDSGQSPKAPSAAKPAQPTARPSSPTEDKKEQPTPSSATKPQPAVQEKQPPKNPTEGKEASEKPASTPEKSPENS